MLLSDSNKQLLKLLADGQFHSGTALASALQISRSAVWKHLQVLMESGVELSAVSGKGYKLSQPLQLLDEHSIQQNLSAAAKQLLSKLELYDVIDSTNRYLLDYARLNDQSGVVCIAESQTAGKGRRGRTWVSPFGHNIYLSILWRYQHSPAVISGLSLALGVAVINALQQLGITELGLKWPNDIYWRNQKLAGILVEVSGESSGPCHAVIGLGINFYLSTQHGQTIDQPYTDIRSILGDDAWQLRNRLLALLLNELLPMIADYQADSLLNYLPEWRSHDCMLGKDVTVLMGTNSYSGTVAGINDHGLLLLKDGEGRVQTLGSGEVSLRSKQGVP